MKIIKPEYKELNKNIEKKLHFLYEDIITKEKIKLYANYIVNLVNKFNKDFLSPKKFTVSEKTILLIIYADNIQSRKEKTLYTFFKFFQKKLKDFFEVIHILPFYPSSGDGGFSVIDHEDIDKKFGGWNNIDDLAKEVFIMVDLIINHASKESIWFKNFLENKDVGKDFFFTIEDDFDTSKVIRPREHNLIQKYPFEKEYKKLWCTFSHDQIDLNFKNPEVLIKFLDIIISFVKRGFTVFRLDAVGFIWKKNGTSCINLPETHEIIKLIRLALNNLKKETIIVTETNLPREENLSYFGNNDEANWIYNFPLPPLILYTFLFENSQKISNWSKSMPPAKIGNSYLNFIASHDGIGMRPVEGILSDKTLSKLFDRIKINGGLFSFRKVKSKKKIYEINISLFDALKKTNYDKEGDYSIKRFIAAHAILLAVEGVPAIYFNSLFGTNNDHKKIENTGIKRDINRHKWSFDKLNKKLEKKKNKEQKIFTYLTTMMSIRKNQSAFHPNAIQYTLNLGSKLFGVWRQSLDKDQNIFAITNVTSNFVNLSLKNLNLIQDYNWFDIFKPKNKINNLKLIKLKPFQTVWITNKLI